MSDQFDRDGAGSDDLPSDHPAQLLGAYALDAVDRDEVILVEEYLRQHPEAADEVRSYREVAAWLGYSSSVAPEGLWDQIQSSLEESAPTPGPELAKVFSMPGSSVASPASGRGRSSTKWPSPRWWLASAAAVVVAVAASAVLWSPGPSIEPLQAAVEQLREDRDVRIASLTNPESSVAVEALIDIKGHGYILATDLPRLGRDQTYQLWGVIGDQVISLGVLGPSPSLETFTARADLVALAITVEPAGGVISNGNPEGAFVGEVA
jgi:anti-sigma-K factor RskA